MAAWLKFYTPQESNLNTLLDNSAATIEQVLDEEDLLTEFRAENQKLFQLFDSLISIPFPTR